MSKFDHLDLDGRLLTVLTTVVQEGSVTRAAQVLGVTQSAVSHLLDKLRVITGDPLFVKSGRGIVATARAQQLASDAQRLLKSLQQFAQSGDFDPARWEGVVTVAANDFQREALLPALMQRLRQHAPQLTLRVIPSDIPSLDLLRGEECQLVISPRPPDGTDVVQKRLFVDRYRVFYDPGCRDAPASKASYLAADHATVLYAPRRSLDIDQWMLKRGVMRRFVLMVPGFAALPGFLRGSDLLATVPGRLQGNVLRDLASCDVPVACPTMPMYAIWHVRYQQDPAHRWLRAQLDVAVKRVSAAP
jgi:DNA-binding transcriptional LysR family regulator